MQKYLLLIIVIRDFYDFLLYTGANNLLRGIRLKGIQDLEKGYEQEVLLFLNMCKEEDGNFLNLPLKKRKIEDAVRLLCITTALSLRGPFFSVINAEEKRFDELISHWERIRYDEEKVTAWLDDFIAAVEDPLLKQVAQEIWNEKKARFQNARFDAMSLL